MIPSNEIKAQIDRAQKIVITAHKNPDGDALGSTLGLYHALRSYGKNCKVILPDVFPAFIAWMPGADEVLVHEAQEQLVQRTIEECDLIFCLDYNNLERIGQLALPVKASTAARILVDHHPFPSDEFTLVFSDTFPSSTSEMVFALLRAMDLLDHVNESSASCLYAGIVTDTGSFRFSCTSSETHRIVALLIEKGAMNARIHNNLFDTQSENRLKLLGYVLSEKMVVNHALHTAWMVLSKEELDRFKYTKGDTEGMVNYGLSIQGIQMAAIFVEHKDIIKISLRSKGTVPVNLLSGKYFSGGGHTNAAGGKWEGDLNSLLKKWNEVLPEFVKEHVDKN